MNPTYKTIITLLIFCIAMAALESAVVVYLRALYYPDGFTVALKIIDQKILLIEMAREAATLVTLITVAWLAGTNFKNRFANFLIAFAVWDIFYYVWLKVFINWPSSFFEWDILFLIPFTWLGPVLAPVICSLTMLVLAFVILNSGKLLSKITWSLLILGAAIILYTFLYDYGKIIISNGFLLQYLTLLKHQPFLDIATSYIPKNYNWSLFCVGELLIVAGIIKTRFS